MLMQSIRVCGAGVLLVLLTACATPRQVADQTVDMSIAIDEANNRMLLLNVARAYYRAPMQFFRVNGLHGQAGPGSLDLGLSVPGQRFPLTYSVLPITYHQNQPSFDLTVLDSQEFMQGMTTPVSPRQMQYLLEQGWPFEMVFYLMVRKVVLKDDAGNLREITNYPENPAEFQRFTQFVDRVKHCMKVDEDKGRDYGPTLTLQGNADPEKLAKTHTKELRLVTLSPGQYVLRETSGDVFVAFPCAASPSLKRADGSPETLRLRANTSDAKTEDKEAIVFRSVEAMIYYLGEITRHRNGDPAAGEDCAPARSPVSVTLGPMRAAETVPLFVLACDAATLKDPAKSVKLNDRVFGVPSDPKAAGRSNHVLSLLTQLIALQNKATEAPVSGTVRLIR